MNIFIEVVSLIIATLLFVLFFRKSDTNQTKEKNLSSKLINIYVEKLGDIYYAWHEKSFLYQSKDTVELITHINGKFPKNSLIKITSNKELIWLQEAKKQLNLN